MQKISKKEMLYLIQKNALHQSKGKFYDQLVVTNKQGGKKKKQRYITDAIYNYMLRLKDQDSIKQLQLEQKQIIEKSKGSGVS